MQCTDLKLSAELYDKCQSSFSFPAPCPLPTAMQSTHLKLIAELYDKCQEVVTQYTEFLRHALPPEDYGRLLPSIQVRRDGGEGVCGCGCVGWWRW